MNQSFGFFLIICGMIGLVIYIIVCRIIEKKDE